MHSWLRMLNPLWVKQADEANIMPAHTPMHETQTSAPNYKLASDPNMTCDNCAFNEPSHNFCHKYQFNDNPTYTCDSWQTTDLNLSDKV